jgi:hypothetical protein
MPPMSRVPNTAPGSDVRPPMTVAVKMKIDGPMP